MRKEILRNGGNVSTIYNLKNTVPTLPAHPRVPHPRIQPTSDLILWGEVQITTLFVHARIKLLNRETEGGGRLAYTAPFTSRRQSITPTMVPPPSSSSSLLKCPLQSAGPCPTLTSTHVLPRFFPPLSQYRAHHVWKRLSLHSSTHWALTWLLRGSWDSLKVGNKTKDSIF